MSMLQAVAAHLHGQGDAIIGTYMDPRRLFHLRTPADDEWFQVICEAPSRPHSVLVTVSAGLFVRVPQGLDDGSEQRAFDRKLAFQLEAAQAINYVLCDLALNGQISAPASPVQMGVGRFHGGLALALGAGGGREQYSTRALGPLRDSNQDRFFLPKVDPTILAAAVGHGWALRLGEVSANLPELVVGAYASLSRHQAAEAILDAYVVIEQLIDHRWKRHIACASGIGRRKRLADQGYTAAVRTEVLLTAGMLSTELYELIEPARSDRNKVAHRAVVSIDAAERAALAMQAMLADHLGTPVARPQVARGTNL